MINFKDDIQNNVEELKNTYFESVRNEASEEEIEENYTNYMSAFSEALKADILDKAQQDAMTTSSDKLIRADRGENVLTAEETKFFSNLADDVDGDTYKEKLILPESTIIRVFEDMKKERPLLKKINFKLAGIKTRMVIGEPEGAAIWGEIFGKIQGQVKAHFKEVTFSQNKLTAFAIVPKDMIELGPDWIERYVRTQLAEAMALQLEFGIVNGAGAAKNQPIGLTKDFDLEEGTVTDKKSSGTLTFENPRVTSLELAKVMTILSTKENGKPINVSGKVTFVVNPQDLFLVKAQYTIQTLNGNWVTSLPYNIDVVSSEHVKANKLIALVGERYHAMQTGSVELKMYDQTLALEDCNLYITKQHAHGMPDDNKVSLIYDLDIKVPTNKEVNETVEEI